jgi:hypothetical protein
MNSPTPPSTNICSPDAIHRDRHTGQFRDHMAIGLGVTFKTACLSLGPGSASSHPYTYI